MRDDTALKLSEFIMAMAAAALSVIILGFGPTVLLILAYFVFIEIYDAREYMK